MLNARGTAEKYRGSYESAVLKRFREFASPDHVAAGSETIFRMLALNAALRNGDAHLKNFGIVYDDIEGEIALAPVYDIVTTTAYIPADQMALTLDGSTRWPTAKQLMAFGTTRQIGSPSGIKAMLGAIAEAVFETMGELRQFMHGNREFAEIGTRMLAQWDEEFAPALLNRRTRRRRARSVQGIAIAILRGFPCSLVDQPLNCSRRALPVEAKLLRIPSRFALLTR